MTDQQSNNAGTREAAARTSPGSSRSKVPADDRPQEWSNPNGEQFCHCKSGNCRAYTHFSVHSSSAFFWLRRMAARPSCSPVRGIWWLSGLRSCSSWWFSRLCQRYGRLRRSKRVRLLSFAAPERWWSWRRKFTSSTAAAITSTSPPTTPTSSSTTTQWQRKLL